MKRFLQKILLGVVALTLVLVPVESMAVTKKSHKRVHSSHKYTVKASSRKKYQTKARRVSYKQRQAQIRQRAIELGENYDGSGALQLASTKALIINQNTGEVVYAKNTDVVSPIASITKLMTAMVMLDAKQSLDETIYVSEQDVDYIKGTGSRLSVGTGLPRGDMLQLALMASENRAASSLASNYPGGHLAFVRAMNAKALALGLNNTHFDDPTGLESSNVSTAEDLVKMVQAAYQYPEIRMASTSPSHEVYLEGRQQPLKFNNTNGLVREGEWEIGLSKTGFISEAGRCLVMQASITGEPMIIVLLDSYGKLTRIGDANRVRKWIERNNDGKATTTGKLEPESAPALPSQGKVS